MADVDDWERDVAGLAPEVIARAAAGDREAQQAVLEAACDPARRCVFNRTGAAGDLEELHVAALARILADLPQAPVDAPLGPWLADRCARVVRRRGTPPAAGAAPPPLLAGRREAAIAAALAAARTPAPRPWYVRQWPVLAAVSALLLGLGVVGLVRLGARKQDAWIVAGTLTAGAARLGAGAQLEAGEPYVAPAEEPVAIALGEAAVLRAGSGTRFILRARRRVELDHGRLELALRPQSRQRPVYIATAEALVRIVGTQLVVSRPAAGETTVVVTEGTVEVTARASGRVTTLRQGEALAVPGAAAPPRK